MRASRHSESRAQDRSCCAPRHCAGATARPTRVLELCVVVVRLFSARITDEAVASDADPVKDGSGSDAQPACMSASLPDKDGSAVCLVSWTLHRVADTCYSTRAVRCVACAVMCGVHHVPGCAVGGCRVLLSPPSLAVLCVPSTPVLCRTTRSCGRHTNCGGLNCPRQTAPSCSSTAASVAAQACACTSDAVAKLPASRHTPC